MRGEFQYRLDLIRDSLIGLTYHLLDPEIILYPFLDNLFLLHQKPLVVAFWEGDRCVYSSLKDPDFLSRHDIAWNLAHKSRVTRRASHYTMSVHQFPAARDQNKRGQIELPIDQDATDLTRRLLARSTRFPIPNDFFTSLDVSIGSRETRESEKSQTRGTLPHIEMDHSEVKALLDPFRVALDAIFAPSLHSDRLKISKDSLKYPNIFAVIRTCPTAESRYNGIFDYTAGLVLLTEMKDALRKWCETSCLHKSEGPPGTGTGSLNLHDADQFISALEQPLGLHSRSVSDLVFSSGIVDFGRQAREKGWDASVQGDNPDAQRRNVEKHIYPEGGRLFYIPIHVGGTPWLSLFTFTPKDPASDLAAWHHNYSFYRDLTQKAAALIRQEAHDVYADLLAKHIVIHMKSWVTPFATIVSEINHDTQKLAQVYPFPLLTITEGQHPSSCIFVPGRGYITLSFSTNPFFHRQVSWKVFNEQVILDQCREAVGDFTNREHGITVNTVAQTSHLLKGPLRVLDSIASTSTSTADSNMRRQIRKILDLHEVASALVSEEKRSKFIDQYKRPGSLSDLVSLLSEQYTESLRYLSEPTVSGNGAPRMQQLRGQKCIKFTSAVTNSAQSSIVFYEPLALTVFDGLLKNALDSVDMIHPNIVVRLVLDASGSAVYLCVENSTDLSSEGLSTLVRRLNHPGPDMVGITNIHWMSKVCWPKTRDKDRLSWSFQEKPQMVIAEVMIAEVIQ